MNKKMLIIGVVLVVIVAAWFWLTGNESAISGLANAGAGTPGSGFDSTTTLP